LGGESTKGSTGSIVFLSQVSILGGWFVTGFGGSTVSWIIFFPSLTTFLNTLGTALKLGVL
jgi:hypothetical protein